MTRYSVCMASPERVPMLAWLFCLAVWVICSVFIVCLQGSYASLAATLNFTNNNDNNKQDDEEEDEDGRYNQFIFAKSILFLYLSRFFQEGASVLNDSRVHIDSRLDLVDSFILQ